MARCSGSASSSKTARSIPGPRPESSSRRSSVRCVRSCRTTARSSSRTRARRSWRSWRCWATTRRWTARCASRCSRRCSRSRATATRCSPPPAATACTAVITATSRAAPAAGDDAQGVAAAMVRNLCCVCLHHALSTGAPHPRAGGRPVGEDARRRRHRRRQRRALARAQGARAVPDRVPRARRRAAKRLPPDAAKLLANESSDAPPPKVRHVVDVALPAAVGPRAAADVAATASSSCSRPESSCSRRVDRLPRRDAALGASSARLRPLPAGPPAAATARRRAAQARGSLLTSDRNKAKCAPVAVNGGGAAARGDAGMWAAMEAEAEADLAAHADRPGARQEVDDDDDDDGASLVSARDALRCLHSSPRRGAELRQAAHLRRPERRSSVQRKRRLLTPRAATVGVARRRRQRRRWRTLRQRRRRRRRRRSTRRRPSAEASPLDEVVAARAEGRRQAKPHRSLTATSRTLPRPGFPSTEESSTTTAAAAPAATATTTSRRRRRRRCPSAASRRRSLWRGSLGTTRTWCSPRWTSRRHAPQLDPQIGQAPLESNLAPRRSAGSRSAARRRSRNQRRSAMI